MPEIRFEEIELLASPVLRERVRDLVADRLGGSQTAEQIIARIGLDTGRAIVIGGFVGDRLACFSAFMRMEFAHGETRAIGYQIGYGVSDRAFDGRGYWVQLLRFAETHLLTYGAHFLFGFPNATSRRVVTRRLSFSETPFHHARLPFVLGSQLLYLGRAAAGPASAATILPCAQDNLAWKSTALDHHSIVALRRDNALIWGRRRTATRLGLRIGHVELGGMALADGMDVAGALRTFARHAGVPLLTLSVTAAHPLFGLLKRAKPAGPAVFKALGGFDLDAGRIGFIGGMRDTF